MTLSFQIRRPIMTSQVCCSISHRKCNSGIDVHGLLSSSQSSNQTPSISSLSCNATVPTLPLCSSYSHFPIHALAVKGSKPIWIDWLCRSEVPSRNQSLDPGMRPHPFSGRHCSRFRPEMKPLSYECSSTRSYLAPSNSVDCRSAQHRGSARCPFRDQRILSAYAISKNARLASSTKQYHWWC